MYGSNDLTIYERYASEWWEPNSPRFRSLQKVTEFRLKQINYWFPDCMGKTIVDLGCGGGLLSVPLLEQGAQVIGIDISEGSLETARTMSKGRGQYFLGDVRDVDLPSASADFVLLADVLDHIPDYERALAEASRILRPGGMLYVNTINRTFRSWFAAIILGEGTRLVPPGTHDFRLFIKPSELVTSASGCNLECIALQGEAPNIYLTIKNWAITFRASKSNAIAYSLLFDKRSPSNALSPADC